MNKNQQEFIGKEITIIKTKNKQQEKINGTIKDETKNTFTIQTKNKTITIIKQGAEFKINNETIKGDKITRRPEERIKIKEK